MQAAVRGVSRKGWDKDWPNKAGPRGRKSGKEWEGDGRGVLLQVLMEGNQRVLGNSDSILRALVGIPPLQHTTLVASVLSL